MLGSLSLPQPQSADTAQSAPPTAASGARHPRACNLMWIPPSSSGRDAAGRCAMPVCADGQVNHYSKAAVIVKTRAVLLLHRSKHDVPVLHRSVIALEVDRTGARDVGPERSAGGTEHRLVIDDLC